MVQKAAVAEAGVTIDAVEFIGIANLFSAFGAFYRTIDQLKH
jgi:hypothetical protein